MIRLFVAKLIGQAVMYAIGFALIAVTVLLMSKFG